MTETQNKAEPYPWQREQWQRLAAQAGSGRLPHALLLSGPDGLGKTEFAVRFAQALFCAEPDWAMRPCGRCKGCQLHVGGAHPDYRMIAPEQTGGALKVDAIREFTGFLTLKSQFAGYRVGIVQPADAMTVSAANSLLKTLEEPTEGAILMLVTGRASRLLPTIRSRCQQLPFSAPSQTEAQSWLRERQVGADDMGLLGLAGGAPLRVLSLAELGAGSRQAELIEQLAQLASERIDPVSVAARWPKEQWPLLLDLLAFAVTAMIRISAGGSSPSLPEKQHKQLNSLLKQIPWDKLHEYLDVVYEAKRLADRPLNTELQAIALLVKWVEMFHAPARDARAAR